MKFREISITIISKTETERIRSWENANHHLKRIEDIEPCPGCGHRFTAEDVKCAVLVSDEEWVSRLESKVRLELRDMFRAMLVHGAECSDFRSHAEAKLRK